MTVSVKGNTKLVEYGIQQEKSDIRAHVSVIGMAVYVYPTAEGIAVIGRPDYKKVSVMTQGVVTAEGFLVPPRDIPHCRMIELPATVMQAARFNEGDNTTEKGRRAVSVVKWLLKAGMFPLWLSSEIIQDHEMQVDGTDILVRLDTRIQVKCDWRGGDRSGCTGNLFIQVAECNPFRMY